jgi:hypothetical protein
MKDLVADSGIELDGRHELNLVPSVGHLYTGAAAQYGDSRNAAA